MDQVARRMNRLFSEVQSRAQANLALLLSFTLQTSGKHHPARTEGKQSRAENNCLFNPAWIDGSINSVNGLLIKLIRGLRGRFVNSDLVVSTCYITISVATAKCTQAGGGSTSSVCSQQFTSNQLFIS